MKVQRNYQKSNIQAAHSIAAWAVLLLGAIFLWNGCSSGGTEATDTADEEEGTVAVQKAESPKDVTSTTEGQTEILKVNPYVVAYPIGYTVALWPEPKDALGSLEQRLKDENKYVMGQEKNCAPPVIKKQRTMKPETCYHPSRGMVYAEKGTTATTTTTAEGTLKGLAANSEPCLITSSRQRTFEVIDLINQAFALTQATLCEVKKSDLRTLPPPDDIFNVRKEALINLPPDGSTVTKATFRHIGFHNNIPKYRLDLSYTMTSGATFDISLVHVPKTSKENDTYSGVLWIAAKSNTEEAKATAKDWHISLEYARRLTSDKLKTDDGKEIDQYLIQGQIRAAKLVASLGPVAFNTYGQLEFNPSNDTNGNLLNPSTGVYYTTQEKAMSDIHLIKFERHIKHESGTVHLWYNKNPFYQENASGMMFKLSKSPGEKLKGCAMAGNNSATEANDANIRKALKNGTPLALKGFFHPEYNIESYTGCTLDSTSLLSDSTGAYFFKTCSGNTTKWYRPYDTLTDSAGTFVTKLRGSLLVRQCFKTDATAGTFVIDTSETVSPSGYDLIEETTLATKNVISAPELGKIERITVE